MSIKQPVNVSANGVLFEWNPGFAIQMNQNMQKAQIFVDSECIRLMKPYTPFNNGVLEKSATMDMVIGSGLIKQVAPHARYQYYGMLMVSSITGSAYAKKGEEKVLTNTPLNYSTHRHPQAGPFWFERMKAEKKDKILQGAAKVAGGKAE